MNSGWVVVSRRSHGSNQSLRKTNPSIAHLVTDSANADEAMPCSVDAMAFASKVWSHDVPGHATVCSRATMTRSSGADWAY